MVTWHWLPKHRLAVALAVLVPTAVLLSQGARGQAGAAATATSASTMPSSRASSVVSTVAQIRQEIAGYDELGDLDRIAQVRDWVYAHTDLAAKAALLLDPSGSRLASQDLDTNFAAMAKHEGGHWCAGVAYLLMQAYQGLGYRSWVLNVGDADSLTHVVTLVEVRGRIYVEDAYFNLRFVDEQGDPLPLFDLLARLREHRPAQTREGPSRWRTVHFANPKTDFRQVWVLRGADKATVRQLGEKRYVCQSQTSYQNFIQTCEEQAFLMPATYRFLERHGLPRNAQFLMLFPTWITGAEGYTTDPSRSEVLRRAIQVSGMPLAAASRPVAATGPTTAAVGR